MKKLSILLLMAVYLISCQKKDHPVLASEETEKITERACATDKAVQEQIAIDPSLLERMKGIENFTERAIRSGLTLRTTANEIVIPVVVHVLYNTAAENISDAQIQSQIDVLNEDYNLQNSDRAQIPSLFSDVKATVGVRFVLSQTIRVKSNKKSWAANDNMKFASKGGSDAVDPQHKLNIWVCNLQKYLGFAYYPGIRPELDGVVNLYSAFGRTGVLHPTYNKGRTATHEVGHWMNLRHIWGDATCGTDLVDDTPIHTTANFGCPAYPHHNSCTDNAIEMTMNYMDYTDDACMFMFSNGQKDRMLAVFTAGGPRAAFLQ
jgi:hypothetical protein